MNSTAIALIGTAMRRRTRIESPADLLRYILIAAAYVGASMLFKKLFPDMHPKIRNFLAAMAVVIAAIAITVIPVLTGGGN